MSNFTTTTDSELWDEWIANKQDNEAANGLIEKYQYLVNYHVQRIAAHVPNSVSKDDIYSLGLLGLYDALQKFDPKRDLKFDTYASFRVRGAIIDGLRKEDWLPRSARDKAKSVEKIAQILEQRLQRQPSSEEIAKELGITAREVEGAVRDVVFSHLLSMEEKPQDKQGSHREGIGYIIPDDSATPEQSLIRQQDILDLEHEILKLKHNEQMVISLFYKEELTFTEIGQVLELTTSRISQIHKQAIFKLKSSLST